MSDEMVVSFPGNKRVLASYSGFEILTDQPTDDGGDGSAPQPYDLFLASLATCAGYYVIRFCETRNLSMEGVRVVQRWQRNDKGKIVAISLDVELPEEFPERYRSAVVRAAEQCSVKRTLDDPPRLEVRAV